MFGDMNMGNVPEGMRRAIEQEVERRQAIKEQLDHFYKQDYISVHSIEIEVLATSWEKEQSVFPIVLLGKTKRNELGVENGHIVKVQFGEKVLPCIVERQFKDKLDGVTVNRLVAFVLGLTDPMTDENNERPNQRVKISSLA